MRHLWILPRVVREHHPGGLSFLSFLRERCRQRLRLSLIIFFSLRSLEADLETPWHT